LASGSDAAGGDGPAAAVSLALRPHQQAAFDEAVRHLGEHDRVTIALPCGTGKTLLGQRLAQHLGRHGRSAILVLVPSVALLAQTMRAWVRHSPRRLAVFVFCHDRSVSSADLHVPVSTSAAALASWVGRAQQQIRRPVDPQVVVFATYQSSPRIAEAHRDHGLAPWHVAIADLTDLVTCCMRRTWMRLFWSKLLLLTDLVIRVHRVHDCWEVVWPVG